MNAYGYGWPSGSYEQRWLVSAKRVNGGEYRVQCLRLACSLDTSCSKSLICRSRLASCLRTNFNSSLCRKYALCNWIHMPRIRERTDVDRSWNAWNFLVISFFCEKGKKVVKINNLSIVIVTFPTIFDVEMYR